MTKNKNNILNQDLTEADKNIKKMITHQSVIN